MIRTRYMTPPWQPNVESMKANWEPVKKQEAAEEGSESDWDVSDDENDDSQ